jgi:hypothetical protein
LVKNAIRRNDASKFLFILNQVDTSAREDNLEDIVSSWQKALVQQGLSAGNFHILFNEKLAIPVPDETIWARYVAKRDADYQRIMGRIDGVNTDRVYRIIGSLEAQTNLIEQQAVPSLRAALKSWRTRVLIADGVIISLLAVVLLAMSVEFGYWKGLQFDPPWLASLAGSPIATAISIAIPALIALGLHLLIRQQVASRLAAKLGTTEAYGNLAAAFQQSTRWWRSLFWTAPSGWGARSRKRLSTIRDMNDRFVQYLNDRFTNPSGAVKEQPTGKKKR